LLLLFLAANCFPWYLSWLLPFLVIFPDAALLLWTALVSLSYHILIRYELLGVWQENDEFRLLEYAPVFAMLSGGALWRLARSRFATRSSRWTKGREQPLGLSQTGSKMR
jgi:hypothetical protein